MKQTIEEVIAEFERLCEMDHFKIGEIDKALMIKFLKDSHNKQIEQIKEAIRSKYINNRNVNDSNYKVCIGFDEALDDILLTLKEN